MRATVFSFSESPGMTHFLVSISGNCKFVVRVSMCSTHLQKAKRLFDAAEAGHEEECRQLLDEGADYNAGFWSHFGVSQR